MYCRDNPAASVSGWMFLEPAEKLYILAQERVFGEPKESSEIKMDVIEKNAKWKALEDIVSEIKSQNEQLHDSELGSGRTVIFAADEQCCIQLKTLLKDGYQPLLYRILSQSSLAGKVSLKETGSVDKNAKKRVIEKDEDQLTLTQMYRDKQQRTGATSEVQTTVVSLKTADTWELKSEMLLWNESVEIELLSPSATLIHPLYSFDQAHESARILRRFKPRYIILYDLDMSLVRQIEIHKATHPALPVRVYFVMYGNSVEEQRYLTTLRVEKQAFEHLIKEKGTMALPEDMTADLNRDMAFAEQLNTRKGGLVGPDQTEQSRVIVDMREFRSELPSLIHRRGIHISPVTLEVGDYILTPDICVERKSINDLIGSLNSGRLYSQATQMTRFYKRPVLLIEFDENKSFSLKGNYAKETTLKEVSNKLVLLTLHFPKLRILWSSSPFASAELFQELKAGRMEPDVAVAATVSSTDEGTVAEEKFNQGPMELLLKFPGVSHKNCYLIMNRVDSIADLCNLSEAELTAVMGGSMEAKKLHSFLHLEYEEKMEETVRPDKPRPKYRFGRRVT